MDAGLEVEAGLGHGCGVLDGSASCAGRGSSPCLALAVCARAGLVVAARKESGRRAVFLGLAAGWR